MTCKGERVDVTGEFVTYPADRTRGPAPDARAWAVAHGFTPRSHYVVTETWADLHGRYAAREIVARGLTRAEAEAHAYSLNAAYGGGPGAEVRSGGTG